MAAVIADLSNACGTDPNLLCETVYDWTSSDFLSRFADWFVDRPLRISLILMVAWILSVFARRAIIALVARIVREPEEDVEEDMDDEEGLIERSVDLLRDLGDLGDRQQRARQRGATLGAVFGSVVNGLIWVVALLLVLGELSISLAPLIASAGIAGIAIGFGAQSMVKDFLAGIFFVIEDQFGVGDIVDVGDAIGVVEGVTLRTTRLRDGNGVLWIIPNGEIRRIGNTSQVWSNAVLDIEVAYSTDVDRASEVIKGVLDALWHENREDATIIDEPEVLGIQSFGDNAIIIRAVVKTEPTEQFHVARVLRALLKKAFDEHGIEIPFPQRTVWVRGAPGSEAAGEAFNQPVAEPIGDPAGEPTDEAHA